MNDGNKKIVANVGVGGMTTVCVVAHFLAIIFDLSVSVFMVLVGLIALHALTSFWTVWNRSFSGVAISTNFLCLAFLFIVINHLCLESGVAAWWSAPYAAFSASTVEPLKFGTLQYALAWAHWAIILEGMSAVANAFKAWILPESRR